MTAIVGVLFAVATAQAPPPALEAEAPWIPRVTRTRKGDVVTVRIVGREKLPDGAIAAVTMGFAHHVRRSPEDVPAELASLITGTGLAMPSDSQSVRVSGGSWTIEFRMPASAPPVFHDVTFLFDPVSFAQPIEVTKALRRGQPRILRHAGVMAIDPLADPPLLAREIELLAASLKASRDLLGSVTQPSDALREEATERFELSNLPAGEAERQQKRGFITKARKEEVLDGLRKSSQALIGSKRVSPFPWTLSMLFDANGDTTTSSEVKEPAAYSYLWRGIFGRCLRRIGPACKLLGVELYLYQRTMLAEMADETWERFHLHRKGDPIAWTQWDREFPVLLKAVRDCHERMMAVEDPELTTTYHALIEFVPVPVKPPVEGKPPEPPPPQDPPKKLPPYAEVEAFFAACKLAIDEKSTNQEKLEKQWTELSKLLPPPKEEKPPPR